MTRPRFLGGRPLDAATESSGPRALQLCARAYPSGETRGRLVGRPEAWTPSGSARMRCGLRKPRLSRVPRNAGGASLEIDTVTLSAGPRPANAGSIWCGAPQLSRACNYCKRLLVEGRGGHVAHLIAIVRNGADATLAHAGRSRGRGVRRPIEQPISSRHNRTDSNRHGFPTRACELRSSMMSQARAFSRDQRLKRSVR